MDLKKQLGALYASTFLSGLRLTDAVWVALLAARGFALWEIGLAEAVYHIISLVFEVPSGMAADLLGRRRTYLLGKGLDAVMNYPLGQSIKDFWIDKSLTNEDFEYTINRCYTSYMQQTNDVLFNLLDSHDTKRLRSDVKNLDEYFAQIAVLFAMPGSPCIYYGTEIAMEGSYDPDCRRCMPWSDIEAGKYAERSRIISTLIHLRRQEPLLKSRNFHFPNDYAAYRRVIQFQKVDFPDCYVEVLINCCEEDVEVVPQGEILLERHYIDSTLLSNGILIRRIRK